MSLSWPVNSLGNLERVIMEVLWKKDQATVREVVLALFKKRPLAYTTVMTVMNRLVAKGLLQRRRLEEGSFLYTPRASKEKFYLQNSRLVLGRLVRFLGSAAVAQFLDVLEEVDPDQLAQLQKILQQKNRL